MILAKALYILPLVALSFSSRYDSVIGYDETQKEKKFIVETWGSMDMIKRLMPDDAVYDVLSITTPLNPILHEKSIEGFDQLVGLQLSHSNIKEIKPGAFHNLPSLKYIDLSFNKLEEIKEGVLNNWPLELVLLNSNELKSIAHGAFDNMTKLKNISLSNNKLTSYEPQWFTNMPLLEAIYLEKNLITSLPERAFYNIGNKDSSDTEVQLHFNENKIKELHPHVFKDSGNIAIFNVNDNEIENLDENIFVDANIDTIFLSNNKIQCLDGDLDKLLLKCKSMILNPNPWDCACFERIKKWRKSKNITPIFLTPDCKKKVFSFVDHTETE